MITSYTDLIPAIARIYDRHAAGCHWHVVLDDFNFTRACVAMCAELANHDQCTPCMDLADLIGQPGATLTKLSKATKAYRRSRYG